jgi:hypothetical protein
VGRASPGSKYTSSSILHRSGVFVQQMHHPSLVSLAKLFVPRFRDSSILALAYQYAPAVSIRSEIEDLIGSTCEKRQSPVFRFSLGLYAARAVSRASLTASSNHTGICYR